MCGICGVVAFDTDEPIGEGLVPAMCEAMRYRGPDGVGYYQRPNIHLGHVRLSIIDVSGGQQPLGNEDDSVQVVYNGEVYNYPELRPKLEARGHVFKTNCDTEALVHLYEDHGASLADHLVGEFAFAIWDEKKQTFLLVRDRLGVKPVYYALVGGKLYFASEMAPLMAVPDLPRRIDMDSVQTYLDTRTILAPQTIYKDVKKLMPGHRLEIRNGQVRTSQYWDVAFEPDESRSEESFVEELRELVDDSVRGQLMSDVPLGAFLSGGVDSSAVVASMVRHHQGVVKTFSIGFEEAEHDESRFYKPFSKLMGVEHHEFVFRPDLIEAVPKVLRHFGEPSSIGSALPLYYLSKMAREHVTVALSGDGGDEVFGGYVTYHFANWIRQLDKYGGWVIGNKTLGKMLDCLALRTTSGFGNFLRRMRKINRMVATPPSQRMRYMGDLRSMSNSLLREPVDSSGIEAYELAFDRMADSKDWAAPYLYADIKTMLVDEMFTKLDRMTMANSMEGRVPLVDYRLVELAGKIPARMKLRGKDCKVVFKKSQQGRVSDEILTRKKQGFTLALNEWFRGPLRQMALDLLTDSSFHNSGIFSEQAVSTLLDRHLNEIDNHGSDILSLVMFEVWRRDLHEQKALAPVA